MAFYTNALDAWPVGLTEQTSTWALVTYTHGPNYALAQRVRRAFAVCQ